MMALIKGNSKSNSIYGSHTADSIYGFGGSDLMFGRQGSDKIYGGAGADALYGEDGNDKLYGGTATDQLFGGLGKDVLDGGVGSDVMRGGAGNDIYIVNDFQDATIEKSKKGTDLVKSSISHILASNIENLELTGTASTLGRGNGLANTITGNMGNNTLDGMEGNNVLRGGAGNDLLMGTFGVNIFKGGSGNDTVSYENIAGTQAFGDIYGIQVAIGGAGSIGYGATGDIFSSIENINGSAYKDEIVYFNYGTAFGNGGDDLIRMEAGGYADGGSGSDTLHLKGNGLVFGGNGADTIICSNGSVDIFAGDGSGVDLIFLDGGSGRVHLSNDVANASGDKVYGFSIGTDKLAISRLAFGIGATLETSVLKVDQAAEGSSPQFLYSTLTGTLGFDADGNGSSPEIVLATLQLSEAQSIAPVLSLSDFLLT